MTNNRSHTDSFLTAVDSICLVFLAVLLVLTVSFSPKVDDWQTLAEQFLVAGIVYVLALWIRRRLAEGLLSVALQTATVMGLFTFLFKAVAGLQHIMIDGWLDDLLLSVEYALTGTESSLALQSFVSPFVTEWMMFAYVIYIPLLPCMALICYRANGPPAAYDYLLNLSLANVVCYLGFIALPVASPLYHMPEIYTVPLDGGFFAWCGEWIRHNQHYAGGSLPSPHCAAGTIMLAMLYRYNKRLFFIGLPVFASLYVSTVYGRYHYAWDAIAGIVSAIAVLRFSPKIVTATVSIREWYRRLSESHPVSESIAE